MVALIQIRADRPDISNVRHSRMVLSGIHVLLLQNYKTGFKVDPIVKTVFLVFITCFFDSFLLPFL